jgi:hypothetical protein
MFSQLIQQQIDGGDNPFPQRIDDAITMYEVTICSTLTLIYRVIPASQPSHPLQSCDECVDVARKALHMLNDAWLKIEQRDGQAWLLFVHWYTRSSHIYSNVLMFSQDTVIRALRALYCRFWQRCRTSQ